MVAPIELPIIISQTPNVQKVQNAEQIAPEMQQSIAGQEFVQQQQKQKSQIPKTEKKELETKNDRQGQGQQSNSQQHNSSSKKQAPTDENIDDNHLLDLRV